jgi:hypothetical protein
MVTNNHKTKAAKSLTQWSLEEPSEALNDLIGRYQIEPGSLTICQYTCKYMYVKHIENELGALFYELKYCGFFLLAEAPENVVYKAQSKANDYLNFYDYGKNIFFDIADLHLSNGQTRWCFTGCQLKV